MPIRDKHGTGWDKADNATGHGYVTLNIQLQVTSVNNQSKKCFEVLRKVICTLLLIKT
jgi:hypothetical protein